ncbi:MAG: low molecular weight phosphotyrosine protein phosphatase [Selenomonas sp.]|uniref:low molecular weight protein-tyrosine-phosphatase n=1 Tax=Selenomonas sp. TaxID=2053611 RepID=UPI0025E8F5EC|nr:low molecular weight protein-tyrosine-phosphatase [Selenomonas sp.]MCR5756703.1 low molecular weight phosphotyrosine protein phosphatase [Selenomonas sp.]
MTKILFVCHGNICRSTMCEFIMKELVRKAGKEQDIYVESKACRTDELGSDTHPGTKAALRAHNIPFTKRKARQIQRADYDEFDYIIAMDEENMRDLQRLTNGDSAGKCQLLLSFAGEDREVADPWYTGNFEVTYQDANKGCRALLAQLI